MLIWRFGDFFVILRLYSHYVMKKILSIVLAGVALSAQAAPWMRDLSDDAYVSQLSIPGTHDSATGHGFTSWLMSNYATTQDLNIEAQWGKGVRAFDLRPAVASGALQIYHGSAATKLWFHDALASICRQLDADPTEFAIVLMRHESDGDSNNSSWAELAAGAFADATVDAHMVKFNPDLSVGDVRGKMIVLSRDAFTNNKVGFISGWSHSPDFAEQKGGSIKRGTRTARLYVQDFYDCTASGAAAQKDAAITTLYEYSRGLCAESCRTPNLWVVNHTSGYTRSAFPNGTWGYRENAARANSHLIKLLEQEPHGPTGIVLMDYAGVDKSGDQQTMGEALVNALIANNFTYTPRSDDNGVIRQPMPSDDKTTYWHNLTARREGRLVGLDGKKMQGTVTGPDLHENQWKILSRGDGTYDIVNRGNGAYINPRSAQNDDQLRTLSTQPKSGWIFEQVPNTKYYFIYSAEASAQLHQTNEGNSYAIFNYGMNGTEPNREDEGGFFEVVVAESEPTSQNAICEVVAPEQSEQWYDLQGRRVSTPSRPGIYVSAEGKIRK